MSDIMPAWAEPFFGDDLGVAPHIQLPGRASNDWAYGDRSGRGVRVAVIVGLS